MGEVAGLLLKAAEQADITEAVQEHAVATEETAAEQQLGTHQAG